jgi:hypothetical protein
LLTASSTADAAVYTVHSGPIAVSLTTAGRCWVELRSASATGPLLFEGVLSPGAQKAFADLTGVWLRLGYPAGVTIHVNGASISIPANSSPFNITVEEAASSPAA